MIMSAAKKLPKKIGRIKIHVNPWAMPKLELVRNSTLQVDLESAGQCNLILQPPAKYASAAEEP